MTAVDEVPPMPTPESIEAARQAQARERAIVECEIGRRLDPDGRPTDQKERPTCGS